MGENRRFEGTRAGREDIRVLTAMLEQLDEDDLEAVGFNIRLHYEREMRRRVRKVGNVYYGVFDKRGFYGNKEEKRGRRAEGDADR